MKTVIITHVLDLKTFLQRLTEQTLKYFQLNVSLSKAKWLLPKKLLSLKADLLLLEYEPRHAQIMFRLPGVPEESTKWITASCMILLPDILYLGISFLKDYLVGISSIFLSCTNCESCTVPQNKKALKVIEGRKLVLELVNVVKADYLRFFRNSEMDSETRLGTASEGVWKVEIKFTKDHGRHGGPNGTRTLADKFSRSSSV